MRAIGLLLFFKLRNSIVRALKTPKTLIPIIVLLAISYFLRELNIHSSTILHDLSPTNYAHSIQVAHTIIFAFLILIVVGIISSGFSADNLAFVPPDLDYLLPSPISRRSVLAVKWIQSITQSLSGAFVCFAQASFMLLVFSINWAKNGQAPNHVLGFLALFLLISTFSTFALVLAANFGRQKFLYSAVTFFVLFALVGCLLTLIHWGTDELFAIFGSHWLQSILAPCVWAVNALISPADSPGVVMNVTYLLALNAVAVFLLFVRVPNFYETAYSVTLRLEQIRASARQGKLFLGSSETPAKREQQSHYLYTLRPFGTGAGAIFWANLCAAMKRPWVHIGVPIGIGLFFALLIAFVPEIAIALAQVVPVILFMGAMFGAGVAFTATLRRQPITRPFPLTPWKVVLAEMAPLAIMTTIPIWIFGAAILLSHQDGSLAYGLMYILCAPLVMFSLQAVTFSVVLGYSEASDDAVQTGLTGLLIPIGMIAVLAILTPFLLPAFTVGLRPVQIVLLSVPNCLLVAGLMLGLASRAYANASASSDAIGLLSSVRKLNLVPRRYPEVDEGLWLFTIAVSVIAWIGLRAGIKSVFVDVVINETIFVVLALLFAWLGRYPWRDTFSWRTPRLSSMIAAVLMAIGLTVWSRVIYYVQGLVWHVPLDRTMGMAKGFESSLVAHPILAPLVIACLAGICEEFLFRGPLQTALVKKLGPAKGIFICAFLFSTAHLDYQGLVVRTIIGVFLGWVAWRTKSLFPAMLLHALIDGISLGFFSWLIQTRGPHALESAALKTGAFYHIDPSVLAATLIGGVIALIAGIWIIARPTRLRTTAAPEPAV